MKPLAEVLDSFLEFPFLDLTFVRIREVLQELVCISFVWGVSVAVTLYPDPLVELCRPVRI